MKKTTILFSMTGLLGSFSLAFAAEAPSIYSQYQMSNQVANQAECVNSQNHYQQLMNSYSDRIGVPAGSLSVVDSVSSEVKRVCTGHDLAVSCGPATVYTCNLTFQSNIASLGFQESSPVTRGNADQCEQMSMAHAQSRYLITQDYSVKKDLFFAGGSSCFFHIVEVVKR